MFYAYGLFSYLLPVVLTGINVHDDPNHINQLAIISIIVACVHAPGFLLCHIRISNLSDTKYREGYVL